MRYKLTIEYNGSNYFGWQKQPDQPQKTIEELLISAISNVLNHEINLNCCGRTDAGVHAIAQIADFETPKQIKPFTLMMAINHYLNKEEIAITNCEIADENFHSRYSSAMRHYQYKILNRRAPSPLRKNRLWHIPTLLNLEKMQKAAKFFLGEHDFSAFRDSRCQALSPIRTISSLKIQQNQDEIIINISAKSFLHHMVRNIAGTLVLCGQNRLSPQEIPAIITSKDRAKSGANAPAHGLYFLGADFKSLNIGATATKTDKTK